MTIFVLPLRPQVAPRDDDPGAGAALVRPVLAPTDHPPVPSVLSEIWLAPAGDLRPPAGSGPASGFRRGIELHEAGKHAEALPLFRDRAVAATPLADHAAYYTALTQFRLGRVAEAAAGATALRGRPLQGHLKEAAAMLAAEIEEARENHGAAAAIYEDLSRQPSTAPDQVLHRLGRAALAAGDRRRAAAALTRLYYEFPLSALAATVAGDLESLRDAGPALDARARVERDLARAGRLYEARRYAEARSAFQALRSRATGGDADLIAVHLGTCDFHLKRYAAARDALQPYLDRGTRQAEARFYHLRALRELGQHSQFVAQVRGLVRAFPESPWSEAALDSLATHYILISEPEKASEVFKELYGRFPAGRHAERAAWRYGWWEYKAGRYVTAIPVFEGAAATFPRSDYRPRYLYWAGRAHERLGQRDLAAARYALTVADYGRSYYGRLAEPRLKDLAAAGVRAALAGEGRNVSRTDAVVRLSVAAAAPADGARQGLPALPHNGELVRALLAAGLYEDALNELRYARQAWGASPAIEATMAWIHHQRKELRRGITLMRRAYPQFLTSRGHELPIEILRVIYPLDYWDLIRRHSTARGLDAYLVAALVAQESTFDPVIRSSANAYGLMQIVPPTGRRVARTMGYRSFSLSMLTNPETNIRIGTTYFAGLLKRFGAPHLALAAYNAGENRVVRWQAERPGMSDDEFIADIPFPETQNYVKRVLGTAEDYRLLYSD